MFGLTNILYVYFVWCHAGKFKGDVSSVHTGSRPLKTSELFGFSSVSTSISTFGRLHIQSNEHDAALLLSLNTSNVTSMDS